MSAPQAVAPPPAARTRPVGAKSIVNRGTGLSRFRLMGPSAAFGRHFGGMV